MDNFLWKNYYLYFLLSPSSHFVSPLVILDLWRDDCEYLNHNFEDLICLFCILSSQQLQAQDYLCLWLLYLWWILLVSSFLAQNGLSLSMVKMMNCICYFHLLLDSNLWLLTHQGTSSWPSKIHSRKLWNWCSPLLLQYHKPQFIPFLHWDQTDLLDLQSLEA